MVRQPALPAPLVTDDREHLLANIARLNTELVKLAGDEEVKKRIASEGGDPLTSTPEEYAKDIDQEETKWSTLIRKLNLKVE